MTTLLTGATVVSLSPPSLRRTNFVIDGAHIRDVGGEQRRDEMDEVIDCSGKLVIPGNVCAHTHLYSSLARGMPAPHAPPENFLQILERVWWRLDEALDESSIRSSALIGAIDAVRCGTTCLVDHHASPNAIEGSLDGVADALGDVGLRGIVCYEVTDRGGPERSEAGLEENDRFLRKNARPLIRGAVGAHASFTLGDASLARIADLAGQHDVGVHIHVAEGAHDESDSLRRSGNRVVSRLADAGILGEKSIAAHAVHVDGSELRRLHAEGTWVIHNCRSNMNNAVGRAPVGHFGARAALGTDGIDGDLFAESEAAFLRSREDALTFDAEHFTALLANGGQLVSDYFHETIGAIQPGAAADLVVLHYDPPTELNAGNFAWHWMFALSAQNVDSVMVGGRWIMRGGTLLTVDEERIRAEARIQARRLWTRMSET